MTITQTKFLQLPPSIFLSLTKKKEFSLWLKYATYRSLQIEGVRHGILPSHAFKYIAEHLGVSLRTVQRDLKQLALNGFAVQFQGGYKLNSKLKSKRNNVRIPVEDVKNLTNSELFIRELIAKSIQTKEYIRTRNASENKTTTVCPQNSGEAISLVELSMKSVYWKSTISKSIKSLEKKTNLSVSRKKIIKDGRLWNAMNEYSFLNKRPKPLKDTVTKQQVKNITDWFQRLIDEKKESFIILDLIPEYYANRKVPYTHYNAILNRIIKKGLATDLIPSKYWNLIAVKSKTDWFTKKSYQYFYFDKNGKSKVDRYFFNIESQERSRIEMINLYQDFMKNRLRVASVSSSTYNSSY